MFRLTLLALVLSANAAAYGQLAVKPQNCEPEPLIREAFMPKGTDVLLSYPIDATLNAKPIWLWKYHSRKLSDLSVTNALGQKLTDEQIRKTLKKPTIVLISIDGKPVHPYYLKVIKPETLIIVDRTPGADYTKNPRLGNLDTTKNQRDP